MALTNNINNDNFQQNDIDLSKVFIHLEATETGQFTNDDYDPVTLAKGTLLGRVAATDKLVAHWADAADGSQYPVGVLAHDITVEDDDTANLTYMIKGEMFEDKLNLNDADTLEVIIEDRRLKDWIKDIGIILRESDELTEYDNS